jgi:DNA-binding IclR family transcriptional regulator
MRSTPGRNKLIGSVAAALNLLETLARSGSSLTLAEIAERVKQPKSSVHRMLASLIYLGYVEQGQHSRYRLTFKLMGLGIELLSSIDVVRAAKAHLEALVKATNENAYLAVPDRAGSSVYVARVETSRAVRVNSPLGVPNPICYSATGRAMLAFLPELRERVLLQKLRPPMPTSVATIDEMRSVLAEVERRGYAITRAQGSPDTGGIAAPVRDFTQTVIGACGIAVPLHRMSDEFVRKCVPIVVRAAHSISQELGMLDPHRIHKTASTRAAPESSRRARRSAT